MVGNDKKKNSKIKNLGKNLFAKFFGFEQGIDITDDIAVLNRRNVVIKNIIFLSNLIYSALLLILSLSTNHRSDWAFTIVAFPLTFIINRALTTLINVDDKDITKQSIAMYIASMYIYISSILVYARLYKSGSFETVSYVLLYYSIVLISLYQDKKLMFHAFLYLFGAMTFIHLMWTYQILDVSHNLTMIEFFNVFVESGDFGDLILRSLVFILFFLAVYVIVSIGQYMQEERKLELIKRRQVQNDFAKIVGNLFNAVFINAYFKLNEDYAINVKHISEKIASYLNMSLTEIENLKSFSLIHLRYNEVKDFKLDANAFDDKVYEDLKAKTTLGADIVKRMELSENVDVIVRSLIEDTLDDDKLISIFKNVSDLNSEIILLSDLYLTFRDSQSYKRPHTHRETMSILEEICSPFLNEKLIQTFIKYSDELELEYNNFLY